MKKKPDLKEEYIDAVRYGHVEKVKSFLESGFSPDTCYFEDQPVLYLAIHRDHYDVVKLLVENGADLGFMNNKTWDSPKTVLEEITTSGYDYRIIILLINNGVELCTAETLFWRVVNWDNDLLGYLLKKGVNPDKLVFSLKNKNYPDNDYSKYYSTPLIWAIKACNESAVDLLIQYGADLNLIDTEEEKHPIQHAIETGQKKILCRIIDAGADFNEIITMDGNKTTPLIFLLKSDFFGEKETIELINLLVEKGVDVNSGVDKKTPLKTALRAGIPGAVSLCIYMHGAKIRDSYEYQRLLDKCCYVQNSMSILEKLIELKPFGQKLSINFITELFEKAVYYGNISMYRFLLEKGANIKLNVTFENDQTFHLFRFVTQFKNYKELEFLILKGADVNMLIASINNEYECDLSFDETKTPTDMASYIIDSIKEIETEKEMAEKGERKSSKLRESIKSGFIYSAFFTLFFTPVIYLVLYQSGYYVFAPVFVAALAISMIFGSGKDSGPAWGGGAAIVFLIITGTCIYTVVINIIAVGHYFSNNGVLLNIPVVYALVFFLFSLIMACVYKLNGNHLSVW